MRLKIVCVQEDGPTELNTSLPGGDSPRPALYTRTLEKMGVSSQDIESVVSTLLADFELNALPYIAATDFPKKMIKHMLSCNRQTAMKYQGSGF